MIEPRPDFSKWNPHWHPIVKRTARDFLAACIWERRALVPLTDEGDRLCYPIQVIRANSWWKIEMRRRLHNWLNQNKRRLIKEMHKRQNMTPGELAVEGILTVARKARLSETLAQRSELPASFADAGQ